MSKVPLGVCPSEGMKMLQGRAKEQDSCVGKSQSLACWCDDFAVGVAIPQLIEMEMSFELGYLQPNYPI